MSGVRSFEELKVWKSAREVANLIYDATEKEQFSRDFGLKDQIRRSGISIVSNIAEGFERDGNKEFINFLFIAKGSCGEARAQTFIAFDRGYLDKREFEVIKDALTEIGKMLFGLIRYLQRSDYKGKKFR